MDSKVKSLAILLWLCFAALPLKTFMDLSKCGRQRTSPTRLKVCTYMAKSIGSIIMILLIGKVCFACEVEGMEQEVLDTNHNSCPHCHALSENTPKLIANIARHILHDTTVD